MKRSSSTLDNFESMSSSLAVFVSRVSIALFNRVTLLSFRKSNEKKNQSDLQLQHAQVERTILLGLNRWLAIAAKASWLGVKLSKLDRLSTRLLLLMGLSLSGVFAQLAPFFKVHPVLDDLLVVFPFPENCSVVF